MTDKQVYVRPSGRLYAITPTASGSAAAPTLIASGASFTVAEDTQVPTFSRCQVKGTLKIAGTLG